MSNESKEKYREIRFDTKASYFGTLLILLYPNYHHLDGMSFVIFFVFMIFVFMILFFSTIQVALEKKWYEYIYHLLDIGGYAIFIFFISNLLDHYM